MLARRARNWALSAALLALGAARPSLALSSSEARGRAEESIRVAESDATKVKQASDRARRVELTPEERIARGDLLLHSKDYERAIEVFSQVVELHRQGKVEDPPNADATFLLGESYFHTDQYLSARRHYREILDQAEKSPYDSYAGRALSRLVDVALRTSRFEDLDDIMARMAKLPPSDSNGSLQYARGKAYFARKDYASAKAAVATVPASSPYALRAQYLLGVVFSKEAPPPAEAPATPAHVPAAGKEGDKAAEPPPNRFSAAIDQFQKVTRMTATTVEQRHVVDLAWMAIGRLFYETDDYLDAADAYSHVDRASPEFSHMLFELSWVYVRLGDFPRAQRSLEVLSITDPDTLELADGSLLRADLLLRAGEYDEALKLYQSVRSRFNPIREQVDAFLASTQDPAVYYDKLVEEQVEGAPGALPPMVIRWAREEAADDRVFGVVDDVLRSRELIKKSRRLAQKLDAALSSPTRVKAWPEIRAGLQMALGAINRTALARRTLAEGMDDVAGGGNSEVDRVRTERRALMKRLGMLPTGEVEFSRRENNGDRQWNKVSQQLQALTLEADKLQAIINGLKRVLTESEKYGVTRDKTSLERFRAEIAANERDLEGYRKRIKDYQDAIEIGRVQIGLGDQRYVDDDHTRRRFRQLFAREVELCAGGADGGSAQEYARSIQPLLARADTLEDHLESVRAEFEKDAATRAKKLREEVDREAANIELYAKQLDELDSEARVVVGEVAMRNFALVRDRLRNVILRGDVGIVQQAWEVRESQRVRVRNLQRERSREEQQLNDELHEVLDDAETP